MTDQAHHGQQRQGADLLGEQLTTFLIDWWEAMAADVAAAVQAFQACLVAYAEALQRSAAETQAAGLALYRALHGRPHPVIRRMRVDYRRRVLARRRRRRTSRL